MNYYYFMASHLRGKVLALMAEALEDHLHKAGYTESEEATES